jgi:hypothetical protein
MVFVDPGQTIRPEGDPFALADVVDAFQGSRLIRIMKMLSREKPESGSSRASGRWFVPR